MYMRFYIITCNNLSLPVILLPVADSVAVLSTLTFHIVPCYWLHTGTWRAGWRVKQEYAPVRDCARNLKPCSSEQKVRLKNDSLEKPKKMLSRKKYHLFSLLKLVETSK